MSRDRLRSAADRVGSALVRTGRGARWLWGAIRSAFVFLAYLHPTVGLLFGLGLFYVFFLRLRPILSWFGLSDQAIGAIAGVAALGAFWVYGLRILLGVDVFAPLSRRLRRALDDDSERRSDDELASALDARLERIAEAEAELAALGRPSAETLSMTADERTRDGKRLVATLETEWDEVARLASEIERRRSTGEDATDGWDGELPATIRGYSANAWLGEARTRRKWIGYWLESDPTEDGTLETALLLDVQSPLLSDELEPTPDAEAQSSSW